MMGEKARKTGEQPWIEVDLSVCTTSHRLRIVRFHHVRNIQTDLRIIPTCGLLHHSRPYRTSWLVVFTVHENVWPFLSPSSPQIFTSGTVMQWIIYRPYVMDNRTLGAAFFIPKVSLLLFSD